MTEQIVSSNLDSWRSRNKSRLLLVIATLYWMGLYTYPSLFTPYLENVGATLTQAGVILGGYGFTQMFLRLPLGLWSDYLQKKKIFVIAGLASALISALGLISTRDIFLIFIFRALAGVAAAFWVQISALYMNYNADRATEAVSHVSFVNSGAIIISTFVGGQVIAHFGYQSGFGLGAVFSAIGFALCFLLPPDKGAVKGEVHPDSQPVLQGLKLSLSDKGLVWGSIFAAISQFLSYSSAQGFVPQYATNHGASASQVSIMVTISTIARIIAIILVSRVLLRYFRTKQILVSSMLLNAILLLLLPLAKSYAALLIIMFGLGLCSASQMTYFMDAATSHIPSERRSTALGFYQAFYGIGMVAGPAVTGAVADVSSLPWAFFGAGIVGLLAVVLMIRKLPDRTAIEAELT
ncbi:MAG: MFS transporter [Eubacteriales bacterium]|nr:MFS transporter [Eubacteriales bacterium]MDD4541875.1 MFS transporter [Eubacteriales bacterium]